MGGHVDPVIAFGAGKNFAAVAVLADFACGHAFLDHGVGTELVVIDGEQGSGQKQDESEEKAVVHGRRGSMRVAWASCPWVFKSVAEA